MTARAYCDTCNRELACITCEVCRLKRTNTECGDALGEAYKAIERALQLISANASNASARSELGLALLQLEPVADYLGHLRRQAVAQPRCPALGVCAGCPNRKGGRDDFRDAINASCTCGGKGPDDPGVCPACEVWHRMRGA